MENTILHGNCIDLIPKLTESSVSLVFTSPPYAEQRKGIYPGVPEHLYPQWTVRWMSSLVPKLTPDASVFLNIREHVRDGTISDYVLKTRLALREAGWYEIEELIWHSPDKPPLGSNIRPRRTWERVLWFSQTRRPFVNLRPDVNDSMLRHHRVEKRGGKRAKVGIYGERRGREAMLRPEHPRVTDLISVPCGTIDPNVDHPALFPRGLARHLIKMASGSGDLVLDPMCGSGTVPLVCCELGRRYVGMDRKNDYVRLARRRIADEFGHADQAA